MWCGVVVLSLFVWVCLTTVSAAIELCDITPPVGCHCWNPDRPHMICSGEHLGVNETISIPSFQAIQIHTLEISGYSHLYTRHFFSGQRLQRLILSHNNIDFLPRNSLSDMRSTLEYLDLSNNAFTSVPNPDMILPKLTDFRLDNNNITSLQENDFKINTRGSLYGSLYPKLRRLELAGNPVTDIAIMTFSKIASAPFRHLSLTYHSKKKDQLVVYGGRFKNVIILQITDSPGIISLKKLHFFSQFGSLISVAFNHCKLTNEDMGYYLTSMMTPGVKELNLAHNKITLARKDNYPVLTIRAIFKKWDIDMVRHLSVLDLSYNQISHVPNVFVRLLTSITRLNLQGNRIVQFAADVENHMPALQLLDLSHNRLQFVFNSSKYAAEYQRGFKVLLSGNNRWKCDCKALRLKDQVDSYMNGTFSHLVAADIFHTLRCSQPSELRGRLMKDITKLQMCRFFYTGKRAPLCVSHGLPSSARCRSIPDAVRDN